MLPTVAVIIPTFRRPELLVKAIRSALDQQGVSVKVVVVDDSPEGSAHEAVLRMADERIRYVKREEPSGGRPALVRNEGWKWAEGEFVHFLDDDDIVPEGTYAEMTAALRRQPRAGVVFGRIEPFGADPATLERERAFFRGAARRARFSYRLRSRRLMAANIMFKGSVLVSSACMVRRECVEPLAGFDVKCNIVEDVDFYLRAIRQFGCVFLDRVVLHYRVGHSSLFSDPKNAGPVQASWSELISKYRRANGHLETTMLRLLARTALCWL